MVGAEQIRPEIADHLVLVLDDVEHTQFEAHREGAFRRENGSGLKSGPAPSGAGSVDLPVAFHLQVAVDGEFTHSNEKVFAA